MLQPARGDRRGPSGASPGPGDPTLGKGDGRGTRLGNPTDVVGYITSSPMGIRSLRRHRLTRLSAWVLVAAATLAATPSRGHEMNPGAPHCDGSVSHDAGTARHAHHSSVAGPSLTSAPPDECSHCPVTACVFVSPCAGTTVAISPSRPTDDSFAGHTTSTAAVWQPAHSLTQQPPTPPPHTLL